MIRAIINSLREYKKALKQKIRIDEMQFTYSGQLMYDQYKKSVSAKQASNLELLKEAQKKGFKRINIGDYVEFEYGDEKRIGIVIEKNNQVYRIENLNKQDHILFFVKQKSKITKIDNPLISNK